MEGLQARTGQIQDPPHPEPSLACFIVRFLKGPLIATQCSSGGARPNADQQRDTSEYPAECDSRRLTFRAIEQDIWTWLNAFVAVSNSFYAGKFPPCPYARSAILAGQVDIKVYMEGDIRAFIREKTIELRDHPKLSTRVIAFPPRVQWQWGISEFVERINAEMISDDVFLNTGVTKTMFSRYSGSRVGEFYFIVVANRIGAVLAGSEALKRTDHYSNWPPEQYELVVERRARMAERYGRKPLP